MPTDHMQRPVREFARRTQWTQWTALEMSTQSTASTLIHLVHLPASPEQAICFGWLTILGLLVGHGFGQRQFSSLVHYRVFNRLRPGVGGHTLETRRAGCSDSAQS